MKTTLKALAILTITIILFSTTVFALAAPNIHPVKSPYDGTKQTITGTATPNSTIAITGGPWQLPSVMVDKNGDFVTKVALTQDHENLFYFTTNYNGETSDSVTIKIVEDSAAAAVYAEENDIDVIAPDPPIPNKLNHSVDAYYYTITGTAEPHTYIYVTGSSNADSMTSATGLFSVKVKLTQGENNIFYLEATDASGNTSAKTKFDILENGENKEVDDVTVILDETNGQIADKFTDIRGHSKEKYIESLRLQGVLQGYSDGTVKPDNYVNRAELLKMATLAFKLNVTLQASKSPFTDVPRFQWFARFIETAKEEGIISGYDDGSFKPEQYVNKAEALKIILNSSSTPYNESPNAEYISNDIRETDVSIWYYKYLHFMVKNRIVLPDTYGNINPNNLMTRGELSEAIVRLQDFINE